MNESDNQQSIWPDITETFKIWARSDLVYRLYSKLRCNLQKYINNTFEATRIVDNLWLGSLASSCNLEALQERKIETIVSVILGATAMYPYDLNYERAKLRDVEDEDIITDIERLLPIIHEKLLQGEGLLLHCMEGRSRSATIAAAYLIKYHNMGAEEALRFLKDKRTQVNPNPGYVRQLHEYAEKIKPVFEEIDNHKKND